MYDKYDSYDFNKECNGKSDLSFMSNHNNHINQN